MIVIFSVHADDACFSVGEWLAQHSIDESVWVVTICGGLNPYCQTETDLDWQLALNAEGDKAYEWLGCSHRALDLWDGKWGPPRPAQVHVRLHDWFRGWAVHEPKISGFVVPMGIHHPDHKLYAPVLLNMALSRTKARVAVYEDLPYRVMYPEETEILRQALSGRFGHMESIANGGFVQKKMEACALFESQWSPPEGGAPRCCSAPERIWRVR